MLALLVVVGVVWAAGGFARRTDQLITVPPGSTVTAGPYAFTFTEATAQRQTDRTTGEVHWELTVIGSGRTTGDETISPELGEPGMFITKDDRTGEKPAPTEDHYGAGDNDDRDGFTPGLGPVRYTLTVDYSAAYVPAGPLRLLVNQLEFTDLSLLKDGEKSWNNATLSYQYYLPVRVLPERQDG